MVFKLYSKSMDTRSIGIFDSGVGGLTVAAEIVKLLPNESIIYLGDTARVPYGIRSKETITKFALQLEKKLLESNVKILVVACNTISATCLDEIVTSSNVPVIGVIQQTAESAVKTTKNMKVGVIGTRATISSSIYRSTLLSIDPKLKVYEAACPLFVPLVEEGFAKHPAAEAIARSYLEGLKEKEIDTLILGCTHYPLLRTVISKVIGPKTQLVESGPATAMELKRILKTNNLLNSKKSSDNLFLFTELSDRVLELKNTLFDHNFTGKFEQTSL